MELRIWNVELVGFADYIIMNYSIKIIIQYSIFTTVRDRLLALFRKCSKAAKIISFTFMLAPTSLTASAQSMTFGRLRHKIKQSNCVYFMRTAQFWRKAPYFRYDVRL